VRKCAAECMTPWCASTGTAGANSGLACTAVSLPASTTQSAKDKRQGHAAAKKMESGIWEHFEFAKRVGVAAAGTAYSPRTSVLPHALRHTLPQNCARKEVDAVIQPSLQDTARRRHVWVRRAQQDSAPSCVQSLYVELHIDTRLLYSPLRHC